jgi:tRNA (cmo5U34)-methyltransferase
VVKPWSFDESVAETFRLHARQHIPGYERVIEKSISLCSHELDKNSSIIDVGCAVGETLERLNANGFNNLYGVDNSSDMLSKVKPGLAELYCSDTLPVVQSGYDAVLMNWTLHFVEDKRSYLDAIYENLNPNGFLILSDKTANDSPYLQLYYGYKSKQGVSLEDIEAKANSLVGKMFINDQQWYRSSLMGAGFTNISIIDADWCFTTFLAWKNVDIQK